MDPRFRNVYEDEVRARAYSELDFPGTYYLAFRDVPDILARHVRGTTALDFGCGTGRSTRFLSDRGYVAVGVDVSEPMLVRARERDRAGEYQLVPDGDLGGLEHRRFGLVLCAFTFDNIPDRSRRAALFRMLADALEPGGRIVIIASAPDIYVHEWASFSTRDFPENRSAASGGAVRIVMLDVTDRRPVEDVYWTDSDYREAFASAGLEVLETHRPLGRDSDPCSWVTEEDVSPWVIYVLGAEAGRYDASDEPV